MLALGKLKKQSTLTSAINGLRDYIIANKLGPGDRLPTEGELSQGLGISRNIVRESMQYFRAAGIVETKQKVGAVIGSFIPDDPFKSYLPFLANDPKCFAEAVQMRMALECGSAPLMLANCAAEDIAKLKALVDALTSEAGRMEFDIQFHSILLRMTRNRFIESMISLTVEFFCHGAPMIAGRYHADVAQTAIEHRAIVEALEARDAGRLDEALKLHYEPYFRKGLARGTEVTIFPATETNVHEA